MVTQMTSSRLTDSGVNWKGFMKNSERIATAAAEIERALQEYDCTGPNPQALFRLRNACASLPGDYAREKAGLLIDAAEHFYSDRPYSRRHPDADALIRDMHDQLRKIRSLIARYQASGN